MALVKIHPIEARLGWDRGRTCPTSLTWGGHHAKVTRLAAVRDERAAYPAGGGPRVTYLLETDGGQASVVFDPRRGRWYVEAIDRAA